jgi:hypothetical protein
MAKTILTTPFETLTHDVSWATERPKSPDGLFSAVDKYAKPMYIIWWM